METPDATQSTDAQDAQDAPDLDAAFEGLDGAFDAFTSTCVLAQPSPELMLLQWYGRFRSDYRLLVAPLSDAYLAASPWYAGRDLPPALFLRAFLGLAAEILRARAWRLALTRSTAAAADRLVRRPAEAETEEGGRRPKHNPRQRRAPPGTRGGPAWARAEPPPPDTD